GHEHLDHEAPACAKVPGRVAEAGDLLVLRQQARDAVVNEIDEVELPGDAVLGHVADDDLDPVTARLAPQHLDHGLRAVQPADRQAAPGRGQCDPSGTDGEL